MVTLASATTLALLSAGPALAANRQLGPSEGAELDSGLTFREACDRTNALQNPTLPDWAVIALDRAPDDQAPGRIVAAGFCDESWRAAAR